MMSGGKFTGTPGKVRVGRHIGGPVIGSNIGGILRGAKALGRTVTRPSEVLVCGEDEHDMCAARDSPLSCTSWPWRSRSRLGFPHCREVVPSALNKYTWYFGSNEPGPHHMRQSQDRHGGFGAVLR